MLHEWHEELPRIFSMKHKTDTVIIQGSSRGDGNTARIVDFIVDMSGFDKIDLVDYNIGHFDYTFSNSEDDFLPLMRQITSLYHTLIFATPVYWYAMSGVMKVFFDRITDCLHIDKDTGRLLRGKNMAMISCGSDDNITPYFSMPFRESASYLGMQYLGDVHTWLDSTDIPNDVRHRLSEFLDKNLVVELM